MAVALLSAALIGLVGYGLFFPRHLQEMVDRFEETAGGRGGLLFIEPPQVHTRERLVNDRFDQANWLTRELDSTSRESAEAKAAAAARASERKIRLRMELAAGSAGSQAVEAADSAAASEPSSSQPLQLDQRAALSRRMEYRNQVRAELMDTLLDDSHDLDGNTLYRFNFDAVVMPWPDVRRYPGTAVFVVTAHSTQVDAEADAKKSKKNDEAMIEARDNLELLQSWQREIQNFLTQVVKFRTASFNSGEEVGIISDPKEEIAFEYFLQRALVEAYIDLARANIHAHCSTPESGCPSLWQPKKDPKQPGDAAQNEQRRIILGWLGLNPEALSIEDIVFPPKVELGFRKALMLAHQVNNQQWPRFGESSFWPECVKNRQQENLPDKIMLARVDKECLYIYHDKGYKRAMIRLIRTIEAMKKRLESSNKAIFYVGNLPNSYHKDNSLPEWFGHFRLKFSEILPSDEKIKFLEKKLKPSTSSKKDIPQIDILESSCDANQDSGSQAGPISEKQLLDYGQCLFLHAHGGKVEDIIARFILDRVSGLQRMFDEQVLTNFVNVQSAGCDVTDCRIEVRSKPRPDIRCEEDDGYPCTVGKAMESRTPKQIDTLRTAIGNCAAAIEGRLILARSGRRPARPGIESATSDAEHVLAAAEPKSSHRYMGQTQPLRLSRVEQKLLEDCVTARELRIWLDNASEGISIYEVQPRGVGTVARHDESMDLTAQIGMAAAAAKGQLGGENRYRIAQVGLSKNVVGFGQLNNATGKRSPDALFGWVVRPEKDPDGRWIPEHHRLSAILSVPSWWKRVSFVIRACWITPEAARGLGFKSLNQPEEICSPKLQENAVLALDYKVQLPRRTQDVTERFRFDFIKAPYLDPQWYKDKSLPSLEAGRPGKLVVLGGRLWRGTVATVGGQPANKITVLPDMKGVIAEFDCVMAPPDLNGPPDPASAGRPPKASSRAGQPTTPLPKPNTPMPRTPVSAYLNVWTSEGRTRDMQVQIYPFNKENGGTPCQPPVNLRLEEPESATKAQAKPVAVTPALWIGTPPPAKP